MNDINCLQLVPVLEKGVLTVTFKGQSTKNDIELFKNAIDARLDPKNKIKRMVFDLGQIDPINNAAGRMLDLACFYRSTRRIPIEVRIPTDIYSALQEITPKEMPVPPFKRARVHDVDVVVLTQKDTDTTTKQISVHRMRQLDEVLREPRTVLSCIGKVRIATENTVTVSLFTDSEEIVGELDRYQFPRTDIRPGMVFDYRAVVFSPGKTEISIEFISEQQPSDNDLMDLAQEIGKKVPIAEV